MDNLSLNGTLEAESSSSSPIPVDASSPGPSRGGTEVPGGRAAEPEKPTRDPLVQAEILKLEGNDAFKAKSYARAIDLYSQ